MRQIHTRRTAAKSLVLFGSLIAAIPAAADDLTVSTTVNTPVATATAANGSSGNITVASGGTVSVASGVAVTVNSNNTLTNTTGTIAQTATSNATAVLVDATGGLSASVANNGAINAGASGGTGNTGILIANGPLTGSITAGTSATVTVIGDSSTGVSITAPVTGNVSVRTAAVTGAASSAVSVTAPITGNLTLTGANSSTGSGGYGLVVAAPVSGTVNNGGTVVVGTAATVDSKNNPVASLSALAGVRLGANIGGGFVSDRYYIDANGVVVPAASVDTTVDTLVTTGISSIGAGPSLWVAPTAAGQSITLGAVGTGDDAFAIVNRGAIGNSAGSSGVSTTAVLIGGGGGTTILQGGINSQANGSISAAALDATATGIDIAAGASVPQIKNQGSLTVATSLTAGSGSTPASAGGKAYGIVVEQGASVPSIVNTGSISVTSFGVGNGAAAITDRSGSLTSIVNTGTITAAAKNTTGTSRAIDLSASAGNVTLANSGTITGDIVFGSGNNTLQLTAGAIAGNVAFGGGSNLLAMNGTSAFAGVLTGAAPLAVTLADTARLDLSKSAITLASIAATGNSVLAVPITTSAVALKVAGAASFTGASTIQLSLQSLAAQQNLTVVNAPGGVSTDHLATLIDASTAPYLFTAGATTQTPTTIGITLNRKTADQIGLTGNSAALFNQSLNALAAASPEATAIANLSSQSAVVAAYNQLVPPSAGRAPLRVAQSISDSGYGAAAQRLALIDDIRHGGTPDLGAWAQQIGGFANQAAGQNERAFHTDGFGLMGGIDAPLLGLDTVGLAVLLDGTTIHQQQGDSLPELKTSVTTYALQPYASWSWKALFVQAVGFAGHITYHNDRTATLGSLSDPIVSRWHGMQYGAGLTVGARIDVGRIRITPSNALSWTHLTQDGYTEQGGGALALVVAKQTDTATTDTGRLSIAYRFPIGDGGTGSVEAHGGYQHLFNGEPTQTIGTFAGGGNAVFLAGDVVSENEKTFGGALGFTQDNMAARFGYDRREEDGFHDQSLALSIGMAF